MGLSVHDEGDRVGVLALDVRGQLSASVSQGVGQAGLDAVASGGLNGLVSQTAGIPLLSGQCRFVEIIG